MPKVILLYLFLFCVGCYLSPKVYSQQIKNNINPESYQIFDQIVGLENTEIYNGTEIIELHRVTRGKNKYFFTDSFVPATVIFDGQPYYNIELNYNFYEDFIILRLDNNIGKNTFKPIQEKVEGFTYGNYQFKNFTSLEPQKLNGYYEVLKENNAVTLLKKHKLSRNSNVEKKVIFYEYEPIPSDYYIEKEGTLSEVNSKSDWLKLYPQQDREIKKYFSKNRKLRKKSFEEFIQNLFNSVAN
tara:strand:+ start:394 stop:1119 length:726 start_codon:yes stop_codon:yes gene_type:complete